MSLVERHSVVDYRHIKVSPISGALGAEIEGVDLSRHLDDEVTAEIRQALFNHLVLFFRDQNLTPEQQIAFTGHFGPILRTIFTRHMEGYPDITRTVREADEDPNVRVFGGTWHSDQSFRENPAWGFTLQAIEVPPYGGDTMFSNAYLAYESLSPAMRAMLDRLVAIHNAGGVYDLDRARDFGKSMAVAAPSEQEMKDVEHPLVRVIPETGRKCLYVTGYWCRRLKGMTEYESRPILDFLQEHSIRPEFTCRFRWTKGTLALLDLRCTQHIAINDYSGFRRVMHRIMIADQRPVGPVVVEP